MIIKSMGGEFDIKIEGFEVEGRHLVMTGRMGVWDAKTYITASELFRVLAKLLKPKIIFGLLTGTLRMNKSVKVTCIKPDDKSDTSV